MTKSLDTKWLSTGLLAASVSVLAACGGGSDGSSARADDQNADKSVAGPLDPVQEQVIADLVGSQIASNLPQPLGPSVTCLSDSLNSLVEGPDSILLALTELPNGGDPAAAFQNAAGDMQTAVEEFAARLQGALMILAGQSTTCDASSGGFTGSNPLAGTPLEPVGAALQDLLDGLGGLPGGESGEDPNLTTLATTLHPLLTQLEGAFDQIPAEAKDAPVVGGLLTTVQTAVADLDDLLPALTDYNAPLTEQETTELVNNLLSNVLLGVLPVAEIDAQTGQDFSGQIQDGIDQATAALGMGLDQLLTPLFEEALDGALSPVLDPVEGLLAQILNIEGFGSSNPLDGLLGALGGNGSADPLDQILALLAFGSAGNPLEDLTALLGGNIGASPLDQLTSTLAGSGLPLDDLLGQLSGASGQIPLLGDVIDTLLGGGILG